MVTSNQQTTLLATGDLGPCRTEMRSIFDLTRDRLSHANIVFGQLEPNISVNGSPMPQARLAMRTAVDAADAIASAGFDVISFASNHAMDFGERALLDSVDHLRSSGIKVIGAGANIADARLPALIQHGNTRVAIVAYNSIVPLGYAAEDNRAGCAPMRAWTHYEQIEHDQPGTPSRVHSFANRDDLDQLTQCLRAAKQEADVVVLSMHWGIHFVPAVIAQYQRQIAHTAIEAGADIVIGHHTHNLKGIETYRGKVIFYSLGNFAIDPPTAFDKNLASSRRHKEITALNPDWIESDGHVVLRDSAMAIAAHCEISDGEIKRVSALPVFINRHSQPEFLHASDPRFAQIVEYLAKITVSENLNGKFSIENDELVIGC